MVLKGRREKTAGGLKANMLMRNSRGHVVSKRAHAVGRSSFVRFEPLLQAVMNARACLLVMSSVAINGRTLQGKALYVKSRAVHGSGVKDRGRCTVLFCGGQCQCVTCCRAQARVAAIFGMWLLQGGLAANCARALELQR